MAMMAALPLAEMAGTAIAPALEDLVGKETYDKLAPMAKEGLSKVIQSKAAQSVKTKIANKFFSKGSTARKLLRGAKSIAGIASSPMAQSLVSGGLSLGSDLGLISNDTADNIKSGYDKALSLHDKLSSFNTPSEKAPVVPEEVSEGMSPDDIYQGEDGHFYNVNHTLVNQDGTPYTGAPTRDMLTNMTDEERGDYQDGVYENEDDGNYYNANNQRVRDDGTAYIESPTKEEYFARKAMADAARAVIKTRGNTQEQLAAAIPKDRDDMTEKQKKLGDILELMGMKF